MCVHCRSLLTGITHICGQNLKKYFSPEFENTWQERSKFTFNVEEKYFLKNIFSYTEKLKELESGHSLITTQILE